MVPDMSQSLSRCSRIWQQSMQQDLAAIGINMTINSEEWNTFLNDRKNGNFDFAREGWLADYNDPINMLEMWQTSSGNNDAQFGR